MRVAHIITGLNRGGAEGMLVALAGRMQHRLEHQAVFSLTSEGPLAAVLRKQGVEVTALDLQRRFSLMTGWWRLRQELRAMRPNIVQTWLYHADLLGGLAGRAAGVPVVWGVHTTSLNRGRNKATTRAVRKLCTALSYTLPTRIVFCSEASRRAHAYAHQRSLVIANGIDTERFQPRPEARAGLRRSLGLGAAVPLVGMAARFHPEKNHRLFLDAAAVLATRDDAVHFVLCGQGIEIENRELVRWIDELALGPRVHLLGEVAEIETVLAGLDVVTLTSFSEAMPLCIAEAMSCAIPCVTPDVGDLRELLGECGKVVSQASPRAIADAWQAYLEMPEKERGEIGLMARHRVCARFSLHRAAESYLALWTELVR